MLELRRAVAVADGPAAGLELVADLEAPGALRGYHLLPATRGGLLRRLGRTVQAAASNWEALEPAATGAERCYPPAPEPPKPGHRQTQSPRLLRRK